MKKIKTTSPEETITIAENFAKNLKTGTTILLIGDIGSGKTTFVKGIAKAFGIPIEAVNSPSFTLMNKYIGNNISIYHYDFYRLSEEKDLEILGLEETVGEEGSIVVIEWPTVGEKILEKLGTNIKRIIFEYDFSDLNTRYITFLDDF